MEVFMSNVSSFPNSPYDPEGKTHGYLKTLFGGTLNCIF